MPQHRDADGAAEAAETPSHAYAIRDILERERRRAPIVRSLARALDASAARPGIKRGAPGAPRRRPAGGTEQGCPTA